jgi:hypothetical protein
VSPGPNVVQCSESNHGRAVNQAPVRESPSLGGLVLERDRLRLLQPHELPSPREPILRQDLIDGAEKPVQLRTHRRFQEWTRAGVFEAFWREGLLAYDALNGIEWTWLALDGATGKAPPLGDEKTGRDPTDRGKRGVKRSVLTDSRGVPLAAVIDGANRNDHTLMRQTIEAIPVERPQPTPDQPQNLCLDKGYDYDECKRGKSPGGFGDRPYRSAVGRQKLAEFRAIRSDSERMLHLRARTFAPLTILNLPLLI